MEIRNETKSEAIKNALRFFDKCMASGSM